MKRLVIYFMFVLVASSFAGCCSWCDSHPNAGLWRNPQPAYYGGYAQPMTYGAPMAAPNGCACECVPAATAAPVAR